MTTVYLVQNSSDDGGAVEGAFSTSQKAEDWIEKQRARHHRDWWDVFPTEIDMPPEKNEEKIKANLEAKGHFFVYDPHHRCMHCGLLIGPLQELEEKALISDHKMTAPRCQPIKTHETTGR